MHCEHMGKMNIHDKINIENLTRKDWITPLNK